MKVRCLYRNDLERPLTDPLPELGGRRFVFRLYFGDLLDPLRDPDGWFGPALPRVVLRFRWALLPFVAWKWPLLDRAAYIGGKLYGVDSEAYVPWAGRENVYAGSQAMCFSFRPFANIKR